VSAEASSANASNPRETVDRDESKLRAFRRANRDDQTTPVLVFTGEIILSSMIKNASFHHIEVPCEDLELAERFYVIVFGAKVYMRRDADRRPDVPHTGTIAEAEEQGFNIDGTYLKIGDTFRIGFLRGAQEHLQREIDHLAFTIDDEDLTALSWRLIQYNVGVTEHNAERMLVRDPFGLMLELWPRSVIDKMGLP